MYPLKVKTGTGGQPTSAISISDTVIFETLSPSENKTISIPQGATVAMFQWCEASSYLFAQIGGTAFDEIPTASSEVQAKPFMINPDIRMIEYAATELHLISSSAGKVLISFYGG